MANSHDIIEEIKKGKMNFENIDCRGADFINADLKGVNFKDCDFSFSTFLGADLTDAKLENCKLFWSDLSNVKFIRTNMKNSQITWSKLNNAYFEDTDLSGANLSWSIAFDTNIMSHSKLDNTNMHMIALTPGDIKQEGLEVAGKELENIKNSMPSEIFLSLRNSVRDTANTTDLMDKMTDEIHQYTEKHGISSESGEPVRDYVGAKKEYVEENLGPYKKHKGQQEYNA